MLMEENTEMSLVTTSTSPDDKIPSPVSINYNNFPADTIKTLCTKHKIRCPKHNTKKDRIERLLKYNQVKGEISKDMRMEETGKTSKLLKPSISTRRSFSCIFRLLHILFDNEFSEDFSNIVNKADRLVLDAKQKPGDKFWESVKTAFVKDTDNFCNLIDEDDYFTKFDPPKIIYHSPPKLKMMWTGCNKSYIKFHSNYTMLGTHESDFNSFCNGKADVLYLYKWLQLKPNLNNFVNGGLHDDDKFYTILCDMEEPCLATLEDNYHVRTPSSGSQVENQDKGIMDFAASLSRIAESAQIDPEFESLTKKCLRNQVDQENINSIERITAMITNTRDQLKDTHDDETKQLLWKTWRCLQVNGRNYTANIQRDRHYDFGNEGLQLI